MEDKVRGCNWVRTITRQSPFAFAELVARIKSLARGRHEVKQTTFEMGPISIDTSKRLVTGNRVTLALTPAEYNLLQRLVRSRGRLITKFQLQNWLSNSCSKAVSNIIERHKIDALGAEPVIGTKRGFGCYVE